MSTPSNEPDSFPFSQWLVALIGCEAALPSARATRARAMVDVMLAAVPDTNAERRVLIQSDILRSTEGCLHSNASTTGLFPAALFVSASVVESRLRPRQSLDRASIERWLQDHQVEN